MIIIIVIDIFIIIIIITIIIIIIIIIIDIIIIIIYLIRYIMALEFQYTVVLKDIHNPLLQRENWPINTISTQKTLTIIYTIKTRMTLVSTKGSFN